MRWLHLAHVILLALFVAGTGPVRHRAPTRPHPAVHSGIYFVTGYTDRGYTASGALAGPGVCATDWRVIPEGAHIHIPGLGDCRALDRGGLIIGNRIDVWRSTAAQCYALTGWYRGVTWWT